MLHVPAQEEKRPSAFDSRHPPEQRHLDECVHCGFCLPACPTYVLGREEMDSPRGRIYMIRKVAEGEAQIDNRFRQHMDNCLGCMACMTACPSGVHYDKIIEPVRAQIERRLPRAIGESLFRRLIFATFPYPRRLRMLALPLFLYQRSGMRTLAHASGVVKLLPRRLAALDSLLPDVPRPLRAALPVSVQPLAKARRRVGMLTGCVQRVFFPQVNEATARVLAAEGCEVVIPNAQECCGALMLHSGLEEQAIGFAKRMIAAFEAADVDSIVINSAGCGSTMKDYAHLLRDEPAWTERAALFSAKCRDISQILCELEPQAQRHPLRLRVAWHDACHLRHAQGIFDEPRRLLAAIPDLEIAEIPEGSLCCGSAGVYNLLQPETAENLGRRKVDNLLSTRPDALASANPGCLLQIGKGLRERGQSMPAFHMVEILDASIRGLPVATFLAQRASPHTSHPSSANP